MANFQCPECDISFTASHQCDGHRQSVHRLTYKIRTATGRITVDRSIDGKFPYLVDRYVRAFQRRDNLQSHFKVHHAQQKDSTLPQLPDDPVQKAISMGMLI